LFWKTSLPTKYYALLPLRVRQIPQQKFIDLSETQIEATKEFTFADTSLSGIEWPPVLKQIDHFF
jgi:hypothetical protein